MASGEREWWEHLALKAPIEALFATAIILLSADLVAHLFYSVANPVFSLVATGDYYPIIAVLFAFIYIMFFLIEGAGHW
jgi:hypothetical protein